jgi:hypothetical protein
VASVAAAGTVEVQQQRTTPPMAHSDDTELVTMTRIQLTRRNSDEELLLAVQPTQRNTTADPMVDFL